MMNFFFDISIKTNQQRFLQRACNIFVIFYEEKNIIYQRRNFETRKSNIFNLRAFVTVMVKLGIRPLCTGELFYRGSIACLFLRNFSEYKFFYTLV